MLLTVSILISLPLYLIFAHNFLNLDNISLFLDNIVNFTISIYLTAFLGFLLYYEIINKSYKEKNRYNHDFLIILSTSFFLVSLFILHNYDYNLNLILLLLVFLNFNIIRRLRYIFIEDNLSRTVQKVLNTSIRVPFIISIILILYNEYTFASYILLYVPLLISIIYMIKR